MPVGFGQGPPPLIGAPVRGQVLPEAAPQERTREDMDSLIKAVSELQLAVAAVPKDKDDKKEKKKKKDSDTEDDAPKKKKKKKSHSKKSRGRRQRSSSRSSSSSSRSSRRSSSGSGSDRYVRWRHKAKSRKVTPQQLAHSDTKKFKKRTGLLTFAMAHPGTLSAHFINAARVAMTFGPITKTAELKDVPMVRYVTSEHYGLTELRDKRETLTLAMLVQHINANEFEKALDIISMRLLALQEAKSKDGSWDKAVNKELIPLPGGSGLQPAGLSSMTWWGLGPRRRQVACVTCRRRQERWSSWRSSSAPSTCRVGSFTELRHAVRRGGNGLGPWDRAAMRCSRCRWSSPLDYLVVVAYGNARCGGGKPYRGGEHFHHRVQLAVRGLVGGRLYVIGSNCCTTTSTTACFCYRQHVPGRHDVCQRGTRNSRISPVARCLCWSRASSSCAGAARRRSGQSLGGLARGGGEGLQREDGESDRAPDGAAPTVFFAADDALTPLHEAGFHLPRLGEAERARRSSELQRLRVRHRISKHRGVPVVNGTFAVAKNSTEDRAISALCPTNDLIDASKLWRPKFARVSAFRTLAVRPGMRLRLYKWDTRHYYHMLRVGRRWQKLFAHPPVPATSSFGER